MFFLRLFIYLKHRPGDRFFQIRIRFSYLDNTVFQSCGGDEFFNQEADLLFRIRRTRPQKRLGENERRQNLQGAFAVKKTQSLPSNILLIDDIYTTGSTVERCAKMLRLAGAENVYFLTVSIGQGT